MIEGMEIKYCRAHNRVKYAVGAWRPAPPAWKEKRPEYLGTFPTIEGDCDVCGEAWTVLYVLVCPMCVQYIYAHESKREYDGNAHHTRCLQDVGMCA